MAKGVSLTAEERTRLGVLASQVFRPAAPIDEEALFAGRKDQLRRVADAINQPGRHAVVFGERGVGKTSLVSVLARVLSQPNVFVPRVNCDSADDYSSLWRKVFAAVEIMGEAKRIGFLRDSNGAAPERLSDRLPQVLGSDSVRHVLAVLATGGVPVVILDEFDRLESQDTRRMIADTIKTLSDHSIHATIVIVGVADSVDDLITQHESVERAIVQIQMPRMSRDELHEILDKGLERLGMSIARDARSYVSLLSQGLPSYTHLLGLHAARAAIDQGRREVLLVHVEAAIATALADAEQSVRSAYDKAVASPRSESLFAQVLLACALAEAGDLGYFTAAGVREPLRKVTGREYEIPSFARHLKEFCDPVRGPVLQRTGQKHRVRYRFIKPLMQPFVLLKGLRDGRLDRGILEALAAQGGSAKSV